MRERKKRTREKRSKRFECASDYWSVRSYSLGSARCKNASCADCASYELVDRPCEASTASSFQRNPPSSSTVNDRADDISRPWRYGSYGSCDRCGGGIGIGIANVDEVDVKDEAEDWEDGDGDCPLRRWRWCRRSGGVVPEVVVEEDDEMDEGDDEEEEEALAVAEEVAEEGMGTGDDIFGWLSFGFL
ncbi:hypothetical protein BC828DRAFT_391946 [Blastocladiella britannica]|nr:hypothetical protein BC828DRAFT_391946 [Blastocladiella britannica]